MFGVRALEALAVVCCMNLTFYIVHYATSVDVLSLYFIYIVILSSVNIFMLSSPDSVGKGIIFFAVRPPHSFIC